MNKMKVFALLPLAAVSVLMAGCNGSSTSASTGTMSIAVADTPVHSATSVTVAFTGVQLQGGTGPVTTFIFSSTKQIDLVATQNGSAASLLTAWPYPRHITNGSV